MRRAAHEAAQADIERVLAHRHDQGADYWATEDGRIYVGNPFSTVSALAILHELGVPAEHEAAQGGIQLILSAIQPDGRVRVAPKSPLYPCYTAEAIRTLCRFGLAAHEVVERSLGYLVGDVHAAGGWRCNFTRFGKGPETRCASPGATLYALDALRFVPEHRTGSEPADRAVAFLLAHWETRTPVGPCHHGIGSRFLQIEFPFIRYNVFFYAYVLSFFAAARTDARFLEVLEHVRSKLDDEGRVVVEQPHRGLAGLAFCARNAPSERATRRYRELVENVERGQDRAR